jgi:hypothetical protein
MSTDRFISRHWFACLLVALHTLLVGIYAWIELDHAWNDMNPTMLVMMSLHVVDYPVHQVLRHLISIQESPGTYLAVLLVAGGAFWFALGTGVTYACRSARHLLFGGHPATNGA